MKPHVIITLNRRVDADGIPHWADMIASKSDAVEKFTPSIDRLLDRHGVRVWVSTEYASVESRWTEDEQEAGLDRVFRLILQDDAPIPAAVLDGLAALPEVEAVRAVSIGIAALPPHEVSLSLARGYDRARESIFLPEAHQFTRGDRRIRIAILDTGVSPEHPEYADALDLPGADFVHIIDGTEEYLAREGFRGDIVEYDDDPDDEVGHGTHVAGILAARGVGMPVGVVPGCRIVPVRVLAAMERNGRLVGAGLVDNINVALKWAVDQGVDVINMSLGIRHSGGGLPHKEVVDYARRKGVTIVAAAGNDGRDELYYPGAYPYVLAVGATDEDGAIAAYSTFGKVDLVAPGTHIFSTYLNREYAFSTGTSHAAPFVTGAVAMLKSRAVRGGQALSDGQAKHILRHTADRVDRSFRHRKAGFGRLNLSDAIRLLDYKLN